MTPINFSTGKKCMDWKTALGLPDWIERLSGGLAFGRSYFQTIAHGDGQQRDAFFFFLFLAQGPISSHTFWKQMVENVIKCVCISMYNWIISSLK